MRVIMKVGMINSDWIIPDWPVNPRVKAVSSTRLGGVSLAPFNSLNLGLHVGDDESAVNHNRAKLEQAIQLPNSPFWLDQVHGTDVITLPSTSRNNTADASFTETVGEVCCVMTADCLPVLFCNQSGSMVAAAHAGWKGLVAGVLENTLSRFQDDPDDILVWLGPAISAKAFEVGNDVRDQFLQYDAQSMHAFKPHSDKWLADIYALAKFRLHQLGVTHIYGGEFCTYSDPERFFSYRRDGITGRQASCIWIDNENA